MVVYAAENKNGLHFAARVMENGEVAHQTEWTTGNAFAIEAGEAWIRSRAVTPATVTTPDLEPSPQAGALADADVAG